MKARTFVTFAFAIVLVGVLATNAAATDWTVTADIPFAFQVGSNQMPAGLYTFSRYNPGTVWIRSVNGKVHLFANVPPLNGSGRGISPKVIFNRQGDRYIMSRIVLVGGYSAQLTNPELEAEHQAIDGSGSVVVEVPAVR